MNAIQKNNELKKQDQQKLANALTWLCMAGFALAIYVVVNTVFANSLTY